MRIATWNVNGLRARLEFVLDWLRERQPDVVGLQELKLADEQFPRLAFESLGYHVAVHGQKAWNGVAVASREPLGVTRVGLPGQETQGARLLEVTIGPLRFITAYCPNGKDVGHPDFPAKLAWFDALAGWLAESLGADEPTVLCGDFNICPGPLDTYDEEGRRGTIHHTAEERERIERLAALGLRDLLREVRPEERAYSWWDYRAGAFHRNLGLRIDLLLGTHAVVERVRRVETDREFRKKRGGMIPSDHAPVYADLE